MGGEKTFADIDREAVERYNKVLKESFAREQRLVQHYEWRGGKLPPMAIEPFPNVRQRLVEGMTDADRQLRKQWVQDQQLAACEPRHIPELYPKNPIRRMFALPLDVFDKAVMPMLGEQATRSLRFYLPKVAGISLAIWAAVYNLKYCPSQWTGKNGWNMYTTRKPTFPGDPEPAAKEHDDFNDRGFKARKVFTEM